MKRALSLLLLLLALAMPAFAQATGDYQIPKWDGTKFVPQIITPAANSLLSWNGSGAPVAVAASPFATGTDAANLTGTLAAARIANSSLSIAQVASLQTTLDAKAGIDLTNVTAANLSTAVTTANAGNYAKPDCLWNTVVRMAADRQAFKPPVLSILTIGDSWNLDPRDYFTQQLSEFSTLMPASSATTSPLGLVVSVNAAYDKSPNGCYLSLTTSGDTGTFGHYPSGATGRFQPARYAVVHYEAVNGGGSFKVQYEDSAGSWQDITTISTNNSGASTYTTWESSAFGTPQSTRIRVVWVSGVCKIYAAGATAASGNSAVVGTNRQGLIYYNTAVGSSFASQWDQCPQAVWTTLLTALKTDIIFIREARDDSLALYQSSIQSIVTKLRTARPTVDIVFIGSHPVQNSAVDAGNIATDDWLRTYCSANGFLFVDMRKFFPTAAQAVTAGMLIDGDVHMTPNGGIYATGVIAAHCRPIMDWINMKFDGAMPNGPSWWKEGATGSFKLLHDAQQTDIDFGNVPQNTGSTSANNGVIFRWHKTDTSWQSTGWSMLRSTQPFIQVNDQSRVFISPPTSTWLSRQIGGTFEVHSGATSRVAAVVSGVSGQTANLQEWQTAASYSANGVISTRIDAAGNLRFETVGLGIVVKSGTNGRIGTGATLSAGTLTVANTSVTANTQVIITKIAHGGTGGDTYVVTKSAGTSFTITAVNSSGATVTTDTSTFDWYLVERQ